MGLKVSLVGLVRRVTPGPYATREAPPHINSRGDSLVALSMPPLAEVVRLGRSYGIIQETAVAPVTALPTTTAQLSIWNGEPDNGASYVIDSVFATVVVSAAAATGFGLVGMLNTGKVAALTADITSIFGLAGQPYQGRARIDLAAGSLVDDGWHPIGNSVIGPASQIGMNIDVPTFGAYIVPPGGAFHMAGLANTGTLITAKLGLRWHEVRLDRG